MQPYTYKILPASPHLSAWVESIFIIDVDLKSLSLPAVLKYPWSVTTRIYFVISGGHLMVKQNEASDFSIYPENFVVGPRLENNIIDLGPYRRVAGITFKPGGLYRLLGIPMQEFAKEIDLNLVLKETRELSEQLLHAQNDQEVFGKIEKFLLGRLPDIKPMTPFDKAVEMLAASNGSLPISKVAEFASLSIRQFERKALVSLGVSPKLYSRVLRFTNAWLYREAHPDISWYRITHEFGYADQMHLVDDFKIFCGATPTVISEQIAAKMLTGIEGRLNVQVC